MRCGGLNNFRLFYPGLDFDYGIFVSLHGGKKIEEEVIVGFGYLQ